MTRLTVVTCITAPWAVLLLFTALACGSAGESGAGNRPAPALSGSTALIPSDQEAAWLARGAAIVAPYRNDLKGALVTALADGPEAAISACRLEVPRLARHLAVDGIAIGRTSHRLRNPENAPRQWVRPLLAAYAEGAGEQVPQVVRLAPDRVGYVEPIAIKAPCLLCHGTGIPSPAAQRIADLYPQDQATGFSVDEFRGLFWVEFPDRP